jgi:hypothetical protein
MPITGLACMGMAAGLHSLGACRKESHIPDEPGAMFCQALFFGRPGAAKAALPMRAESWKASAAQAGKRAAGRRQPSACRSMAFG